jgi:hypothetical protein
VYTQSSCYCYLRYRDVIVACAALAEGWEETTNLHHYRNQAKKAYKYSKRLIWAAVAKFGVWISRAWHWLVYGWEPERLTALSTFAIFLATTVAACVGIAQWNALKRTDESTRESFTAVQRAFVFGKELIIVHDTGILGYWRFAVAVQNSGNTPTKAMDYMTISDSAPPIDPEDVFRRTPKYVYGVEPSINYRRSGDLLGPRDDFVLVGSETGLPQSAVAQMADSRTDYYVRGVIHYRDVFRDTPEHITKFCYAAIPYKSGQEVKVRYERCLYWNCADEDCEDDRKRWDHDIAALNHLPQPK